MSKPRAATSVETSTVVAALLVESVVPENRSSDLNRDFCGILLCSAEIEVEAISRLCNKGTKRLTAETLFVNTNILAAVVVSPSS